MKEYHHGELQSQLDTGVTCNVMSLRDLAVITQTGDPPLKSSKVKLRLFDGSLMKPHGVATLKIHRNGSTTQLNFQIVDTKNKPLLSADTCERMGLLKVTINETSEVNTVVTEQDKLRVPLTREAILKEYKELFEGLGHIGFSSSFVVNPAHTPVQHAPRRVAVTLQKLRSQRENCRDGEEGNHTKGDRAGRMDQQHGCSSKTRKNQNLPRPSRPQLGNPKTQISDANFRASTASTQQSLSFYNPRF